MGFAEVVGVRLSKRRERADNRGRLRVDIRQRRDGLPGASVARASPWGPHGGTVSLHGPLPCAVGPRHAVLPNARSPGGACGRWAPPGSRLDGCGDS
jgi:hypothetical protein